MSIPAALALADSPKVGSVFDSHESARSPGSSGDFHPITQDEDVDSPVLADVAHRQHSRVAADSTDDEHFDRLDSHV